MNLEYALFQFIYALIPFFVQICVGESLFVYGLKRRRFFVPRIIAGMAVCVGFLYMASVLIALVPHFLFGSFVYMLIFALTLGVLKMCFDESFGTLLFCGLAAYGAQNIAYRLSCIAEVNGLVYLASHKIGYTAASIVLNYTAVAAVYIAVYFLFARRIKKHKLARLHSVNVLLISASMLTVTVVLCSWTNTYYWHHVPLLTINFVFSVLACVFMLCLQSGMMVNLDLKHDIEIVEKMWRDDIARYEISKENIDIINIKCHDLKHRLQEMRLSDGNITSEEIEEIENAVGIYDANINTGCEPLDVILTEKSLFCRKNGILLTCMADGESLSFMHSGELYTLFGNMLSNAIEAAQKVCDENKRVIDFTVRRVGDMVVICTENYYNGQIAFKNGLPQTSKADSYNHGYGTKSMKMLVEKYGGELKASADGEIYRLKILLPIPSRAELKIAS